MSRSSLTGRLIHAQTERTQQQLARRLRTLEATEAPWVVVNGKRLLSFASNDYLGLAQHPALYDALCASARHWGVGATAAHLLGGHREPHEKLEAALATWTGRSRALLFSTGYMANLGVITALLQKGDLCLQDKLNHASLVDGARLAGCTFKRYVHADIASATRQLAAHAEQATLLATDGVFSMDGDIAPLPQLANLCEEQGAALFVDDAHGLGVVGTDGAGSVSALGLSETQVPILMGTLGKALGVFGAFVAGSTALIEGLVQFARPHIYTTAIPPALAAAALVAIDIARLETWRRDQLQLLIRHFRDGASARNIQLLDSTTPIQPVLIGDSIKALEISIRLEDAGFFVPAIRPPTVPAGKARLRVTLSALHEESDVEHLLDTLHRVQHLCT